MTTGATTSDWFNVRPAELLASTRLFSGLSKSLIETLASICTFHEYAKGAIIFEQGDPGDVMYIIIQGSVKVFVRSQDGSEMVLVDLRPHESFGELALLDGEPRSASVIALEPCVLMSLNRGLLLSLLRDNGDLMEALLRTLGGTVRRLTEHTSDLVFLDLHERVSKLLLGLMGERGEPHPEGVLLDLPHTLTDLAAVVGGSQDNVHEILRSFEQFGYLDLLEGQLLIRDATRLLRAIDEGMSWATLAQQVFHDPLTGLANRVHFDDRVNTAIQQSSTRGRPIAVLLIDLDDFKSVNDTLGHQAGDELLIKTADRLLKCIRPSDTAARLGGDEFALLLAEVDSLAIAKIVADRVVRALDQTTELKDGTTHTSASVGLALAFPGDGISTATLLERADAAMYHAKRGGKHGYAVYDDTTPPVQKKAAAADEG